MSLCLKSDALSADLFAVEYYDIPKAEVQEKIEGRSLNPYNDEVRNEEKSPSSSNSKVAGLAATLAIVCVIAVAIIMYQRRQ